MTSLKHESLAEITEDDLVERLMADPDWRARLVGVHGIPSNATVHLRVPLDGLPNKPKGDIDILLVPPESPECSTAIQVKRVKVSEVSFGTGMPSKLKEISKLKRQANALVHIGFAQVYCFVLVVIDSRHRNIGRASYEGITAELRKLIDDSISTSDLERSVGLIRHEIAQPVDAKPLTAGVGSITLKRLAMVADQPPAVTEWVRCIDRQRPA